MNVQIAEEGGSHMTGGDPAPRPGAWMLFAIGVVRPLSRMFTRRRWHDLEHEEGAA